MKKAHYTIGRSEQCDIVIDHVHVSRIHAYLEYQNDRYYIRDNQSSNGTYLNSLNNPVESASLGQDDVLFFSGQYSVPARLLIDWAIDGHAADLGQQVESSNAVIRIGRAPDNDVVLSSLRAAPYQAEILVQEDHTRTLRDLQPTSITYVDGIVLGRAPVMVTPHSSIEIGGARISLDFSPASPTTRIAANRQGVYLKGAGICWEVGPSANRLRILDDIDVTAFPGEVIGLMGPSGSGKTSLLDILCGAKAMSEGSVRFEGTELASHKAQLLPMIGYVPQDDLLYAELTIREALFYYAKLRLPGSTENEAINQRIEALCEQLGLSERIDTRIGEPGNKTLSGGQRKRVSIALELLTDPLILFLDEPTSGLSSRDARVVMELLRKIAREAGVAVVVTIHQPAMRVYQRLDHVCYLKDGRLAYFGPAYPDSIRYFEPGQDAQMAGPDAIMERLEEDTAESLKHRFLQRRRQQPLVDDRIKQAAVLDKDSPKQKIRKPGMLSHWRRLLARYFLRLSRSLTDLMVMGSQAVVIGGLIGLAFIDQYPLNTPIFLLSFVAIWLSTNNSAREIVSERTVFNRERRGGVRVSAYFAALVCGQLAIILAQNIIILGLAINLAELHVAFLPALAVCTAAGIVGIMLGLLISVLSKTEVSALIAVPLVLVPFILVGGMMISYDNMPWMLQALAEITPSKWAYESLLAFEQHAFQALPAAEQTALNNAAGEAPHIMALNHFSERYQDLEGSELTDAGWLSVLVLIAQALMWGGLAYWKLRSER